MPDQQAVWDETYEFRKNRFPRLVAEGDSWFAYPVWRNMLDFVSASNKFAIRRRGESGRRLRQIVDGGLYLDAVRREGPRAVLVSGGGNDFVNEQFVTGADGAGPLFSPFVAGAPADELINEMKWEAKLSELSDGYATIVQRVGPIPVLAHGYDYIIPSGIAAKYDGITVGGPWIQPQMIAMGIVDPTLQSAIVALMIDSFNNMLASVQNAHTGNFIHVDLRGTVKTADWANEIHPYEPGFRALGAKLLAALTDVLAGGGVIAAGVNP